MIDNRQSSLDQNGLEAFVGEHKFSLIHKDLDRVYNVYVPKSYNEKSPSAIVIYIHGGGGDETVAKREGLNEYADKYNFILVSPRSTMAPVNGKNGKLGQRWNGGRWSGGECCGNADDVGFISKMIDKLKKDFNINKKMVYVTGISNGGLMTNRLGCDLSEKISAIAIVASTAIKSDCDPSRNIPIMNIHGTDDPANPLVGSDPYSIFKNPPYQRMTPYEVIDVWKEINNCSNNTIKGYEKGNAKCVIYDECSNNSEVELCIVKEMGHTYPCGWQYMSEKIIGQVSCDISFDQIWDFFINHPMD